MGLRTRLTLAFSVAMAIVVAAIGLFVQLRVERSLRGAVDQGLRARAVDVANLENQANNGLSSGAGLFAGGSQGFGQLIDTRGRVVDATRGLRRRPLLGPAEIARARRRGAHFVELRHVNGAAARLFVVPVRAQDQPYVLIVGTSLAAEQSAVEGLRTALLIGCPIALLLTSLGGYLLAGAALRPVEQAREREQQFLADASHELRTPLALLKTELELALDGPHSPSELAAALSSAGEETDRLIQLAEDLLLLAQADRGAVPLRLVAIDARELAQRVVRRFEPRATTAGRRIETDIGAGLILHVDPIRIEQALANLVENALRHGAGTITLQIGADHNAVELHVRDQGDGIAEDFRAHAFERFSRPDGARSGSNVGLGLAIVAAIADAHGGVARAGDGPDIYLRLPATRAEVRSFARAPTPVGEGEVFSTSAAGRASAGRRS